MHSHLGRTGPMGHLSLAAFSLVLTFPWSSRHAAIPSLLTGYAGILPAASRLEHEEGPLQ